MTSGKKELEVPGKRMPQNDNRLEDCAIVARASLAHGQPDHLCVGEPGGHLNNASLFFWQSTISAAFRRTIHGGFFDAAKSISLYRLHGPS
jgi:hypothetical protein